MELERDRLKHLLIILLEALSSSPGERSAGRARIQEKAEAAGLDEEDVHGLLDWIESQWRMDEAPTWAREPLPDAPSRGSFRLYGEAEKEYLSDAALGWLVGLKDRAQIDQSQLEAVLQYASFVAMRPLEVEDLEMVIEQVLFRAQRPGMTGGMSDGQSQLH